MLTDRILRGVEVLFRAGIRWGFLTAGAVMILAMTPGFGLAEEDVSALHPDFRIPRLGGHRFTPNTMTDDPFIKTYIRNSLGIGKAVDLFVPILRVGDPPERVIGLKGDLLKAILEFEFQQAVKDWVAFRVKVKVMGRLGTGAQSLLATGVTANTGFEFGWMFKLAQGEKTALSGTVDVRNNSVTVVDFLGFVDGVVNPPSQPLVQSIPVVRVGAGLRYAWAASDLTGFTFKSETGMGESVDRSLADEWFINFSAAADFDLKAKTVVPLGLVIAYQVDSFPEGGEELVDVMHYLAFRIAYTGTTDFLISLDLSYDWFKNKEGGESTKLTTTLISLRYYF
jgi:hypothetical protein